jgi:hypothetical protein
LAKYLSNFYLIGLSMFFGMVLMALPPKNGCRVGFGVWVNEASAAARPSG